MIEITESVNWDLWDEFVYNHPQGNVFQTSHMFKVYESTKNYKPISLAAVDSINGNILAILHAVVIQEKKGIVGTFSARSVIYGGPLYIPQKEGYEAVGKLMEHYEKIIQKNAIYTQIRNLWDTKDIKPILKSCGYTYEDHLNYLIDLNQSTDKIWQHIKKSRRGDIKNAEKNGIKVSNVENLSEIKDFYLLIQETCNRSKLLLADISLFESAFNELKPRSMVDFYLAIQNDNYVGSCMMLKYKNMVYNWYMGSASGVNYVDGALIWHVLKENAETEKVFDFGGAGRPDQPYGVRDFKKRFGGTEVNFGRYLKVHNKLKKQFAETGLNICKKFISSSLNHNGL